METALPQPLFLKIARAAMLSAGGPSAALVALAQKALEMGAPPWAINVAVKAGREARNRKDSWQ